MKLLKIIPFIVIILFTSCGTGYEVITHDDSDGSYIVHRTKLNRVSADRDDLGSYGQISIDGEFYKPKKSADSEHSALVVSSITLPALQIQSDRSLVISIDGKTYIFSGIESQYRAEPVEMARNKYLLERAKFLVEKDIFKQIGSAKSVTFSVKGKDRVLNGAMSPLNISRFSSFYEDHVR